MGIAICTALLLAAPTPAGGGADWQPVATELLKREKTGFGGLCGVLVEHRTGQLWVNLSDRGMFHSADRGKTWRRVSDTQPKGRTETPGCWLLDPTGKSGTMVTALVYGSPLAVSADRAATWTYLNDRSRHIDWCAVDWTDPDRKFVLALKHEAGGLLLRSADGGKTFAEAGKGFGPGWVFDGQTAVVAAGRGKGKAGLWRTTDGGKTFRPCGDATPVGRESAQALPRWRDGTLYWLVDGGLIATTDRGATWKKVGAIKDGQYGPVFGKDAKHLFVLTRTGVVESTDGGATWVPPVAPPKGLRGVGGLTWLEYDPQSDTLYLMRMGTDLYRLERGKAGQEQRKKQFSENDAKKSLSDLIVSPDFLKHEQELLGYIRMQNEKKPVLNAGVKKEGKLWIIDEWVIDPIVYSFHFKHIWTKYEFDLLLGRFVQDETGSWRAEVIKVARGHKNYGPGK